MKIPSLLLFLASLPSGVMATNFLWNAPSGDWANGANWTPSGPPGGGGGNFAFVNNGGVASITGDTNPIQDPFIGSDGNTGTVNHSAGTLSAAAGWTFVGINGGNGTYNMTGSSSLNTGRLYVGGRGGAGSGTLNVNTTGTLSVSAVRIADNDGITGSTGTASVSISSGTINSGGEFQVGRWGGVGTVNQTGGVVNVNSGWFGIANDNPSSAGSSYSLSGGDLNLNGTVSAEIGADTAGSFALSGTGNFNTHQLFVGFRNNGNGVLNQSGGNLNVRGGESRIGANAGATGVWNLSGGSVTMSSNLQVGATGTGTLNITGGVINNSGWMVIGRFGGGNGTANVSAGEILHTNAGTGFIVGEDGTGVLNVSGTGSVRIDTPLGMRVGHNATGNGTVNLSGGSLAAHFIQKTNAASTAKFNFNGGELRALTSTADFFVGFEASQIEIQSGGAVINTNSYDIAINQGLSGSGGLTKIGTGTLTLNGVSSYAGRTVVAAGTLKLGATGSIGASVLDVAVGASVDGSAVPGGMSIPADQTLSGNGTITGDLAVNGTLAPGNSIGTLTILGNLTLGGDSNFELDRGAVPNADLTAVSGSLTYGGTLTLSNIGTPLVNGDTFNLFDFTSASGEFAAINWPAGSDATYWINNLATNGTLTYVPEPSSLMLGIAGLAAMARRRRA